MACNLFRTRDQEDPPSVEICALASEFLFTQNHAQAKLGRRTIVCSAVNCCSNEVPIRTSSFLSGRPKRRRLTRSLGWVAKLSSLSTGAPIQRHRMCSKMVRLSPVFNPLVESIANYDTALIWLLIDHGARLSKVIRHFLPWYRLHLWPYSQVEERARTIEQSLDSEPVTVQRQKTSPYPNLLLVQQEPVET